MAMHDRTWKLVEIAKSNMKIEAIVNVYCREGNHVVIRHYTFCLAIPWTGNAMLREDGRQGPVAPSNASVSRKARSSASLHARTPLS